MSNPMIKEQFNSCQTVEEVKTLFKNLARKYHPDLGGDTAIMQVVNACYHEALQRVQYNNKGDNKYYRYDDAHEKKVAAKLMELLAIVTDNILVELVGDWIWLSGDTKPIKEVLKEHGCRWSAKRKKWYWSGNVNKKKWASKLTYDEIKQKYGSKIAKKYSIV